jgi:hypothetical protein
MLCFLTRSGRAFFNKPVMTNGECVRLFYRCLLGREAEPGGLNAWTALADREANIKVVLEHFVESPEFAARTASDDQLLAAANLLRMNDCDPNDIFVVGYPKSGKTRMQHLLAGWYLELNLDYVLIP